MGSMPIQGNNINMLHILQASFNLLEPFGHIYLVLYGQTAVLHGGNFALWCKRLFQKANKDG